MHVEQFTQIVIFCVVRFNPIKYDTPLTIRIADMVSREESLLDDYMSILRGPVRGKINPCPQNRSQVMGVLITDGQFIIFVDQKVVLRA